MDEQPLTNPLDVLRTLAAYWRTIAGVAVAGFAVALTLALVSTPVYRAETLLSFNEDSLAESGVSALASQFSGLSAIADIGLGLPAGQKDVALALLTSRGFLEDFIGDNDLLPALFDRQWDADEAAWRDTLWSEPPTIGDGVRRFRERILTVSEDRRTGLVRLAVEWRDPATAAEWANELVGRANDVTRDWAVTEARDSQRYLQAVLEKTSVLEVRSSINSLIETELKKEMLATVRVQYSFRVIDEAKAPDADDFVRPRRLVLTIFGLFAGFILGIGVALVRNAARRLPR